MSFYNAPLVVFEKGDELEKHRRHNQAQSGKKTSENGIEFIIRRHFRWDLRFF